MSPVPEELASHVLLLAAVPDEVRRAFRSRLLDKVIAYDIEHQADLVRTLEAFLRSDGSWTRCAAHSTCTSTRCGTGSGGSRS